MIESARTSPGFLTFDEAWLYCLTLDHNGHRDWRMPTFDERMDFGSIGTWDIMYVWQIKYQGEMKDKMCVLPVRDTC